MKKTELLTILKKFVEERQLWQKGDKVLLAVSGGVDSVAMVHLLSQLEIVIAIAHCNFQLRGEEANGDEIFVTDLAHQLQVPIYTTRFDTQSYADDHGISIQMAARQLRYEWLEGMRKQNGYQYLATAHHKNDNVETVLLNMVKGAGLAGLHGILPKSGVIIRPMLCFERLQLEQFVKTNGKVWREDKSNSETKYQRNFIRHNVIPQLLTINPKVVTTMANNIEHFADAEYIYQYGLQKLLKKLAEVRKDTTFISIAKLKNYPAPKTLLFELLSRYDFNNDQVDDMWQALNSKESKQFISPTHRLIKERKHLVITLPNTEEASIVLLEPHDLNKLTKLPIGNLKYHLKTVTNYILPTSPKEAGIDFAVLVFPIIVRKWQLGDYFYPIGMAKKKKKVSKFLMDLKLSQLEKENVWVMLSGDRLVWVIGYRMDERFKITASTKQILEVKLK